MSFEQSSVPKIAEIYAMGARSGSPPPGRFGTGALRGIAAQEQIAERDEKKRATQPVRKIVASATDHHNGIYSG
jgi:hypothetical protein